VVASMASRRCHTAVTPSLHLICSTQAAKEQEMTKALEGQKKLKKRLEKAKQACAGLEKAVSQREDLVKEEDKRLQEVLDKARRFTKKLLDDEDYRPPNDEIKRFKNEDAVLSRRLVLLSMLSRLASTPERQRAIFTGRGDGVGPTRRRRDIYQTQVLAKINHTEKMKEQQLEKRGGKETDPEVAKQKMERAQLAYAEKEAGCKQIEQEGIQLREDAHARYDRLRRIRKHICRMSNREFDKILQKKGSSGALRFDHEDATLKMTYQKDNQDETTQIDNIQSLSGGERSFSTLAMLVSLGATIECPFRVMDEFDVFMDQVSRKVAMQELVDMAREMPNRQFVFITPQDLSSLPVSDHLRVFKLNAPIRGQQTLDAFTTKRQRTTQGG
jgi:chromosome segregation ATPase